MRFVVGAAALGAGAVLAAVGATLPVFEQILIFTPGRETFSMTLWGYESSIDTIELDEGGIEFGVPVVASAVLLAVSALLVLAAPRLPVGITRPVAVAAIGSAAVLTGSVWTVGQVVLRGVRGMGGGADEGMETVVGAGTGVLVLACVVALAGGLLVQPWSARERAPRPEPAGAVVYRLPDDEADTPTPPFGTPAPGTAGGGS
ncbi:hypothetical protein [Umezawaea sp.]|uniref:hypothetical protein n=1 Tax=Umezawaea sp. TaxID=1955258 RepID=UPI002ED428FB